jgi:two-component system, OmpR family, response regulator
MEPGCGRISSAIALGLLSLVSMLARPASIVNRATMADSAHLLIVEDERSIREPLAQYLARNEFRVTQAKDAADARRLLAAHAFDLIVMDIMMPGEDGLSLCRYVRETYDVPVLLLTAKAEDADRIVGLEIGADDYVVKPFNPRELLARIKVIIRRAQALPTRQRAPDAEAFTFGTWVLKTGERELIGEDNVAVPLSSGEFALLMAFVSRPRMVLTREQLLDLTQGRDTVAFDRSIDNQVSRLRKKIEIDAKTPKYIKTVWGGGYSFVADVRRL